MSPATLAQTEKTPFPGGRGPGGSGDDYRGDDFGGDGWYGFDQDRRDRACRTGIWVALAAVVMLFAALTSALVVRRGLSNDWRPTPLPAILWFNTAILLTSSATLAASRKPMAAGDERRFAQWLYLTVGLGLAFVAGQWVAWRELAAQGFYLSSNPSSSFFYLLTAAHGIHLLGGLCALIYLVLQLRRHRMPRTAVDVTSTYWHFMDGLWISLFVLLMSWR